MTRSKYRTSRAEPPKVRAKTLAPAKTCVRGHPMPKTGVCQACRAEDHQERLRLERDKHLFSDPPAFIHLRDYAGNIVRTLDAGRPPKRRV